MLSVTTDKMMKTIGRLLGERLHGGEVIELIGDVGAGKTTLVKGIGEGIQVNDDVQSPSFTISRVYQARDGLELHHYDLYRLTDAGVMRYELAESTENPSTITVIEWAETVQDVLPTRRVKITIRYRAEDEGRTVDIHAPEEYAQLRISQRDIR